MSRRRDERKRNRRIPGGATDPVDGSVGGTIAGPGGPYDRDAVVVDTTNAVLLDTTVAAIVALTRGGKADGDAIALTLEGRVNHREARAEVLYLMDEDGAAALIAELVGVAARAGSATFPAKLEAALERMPT